MLTSPFVRRLLLFSSGFGAACIIVLALVGLSVPGFTAAGESIPGISVLRWRMTIAQITLLFLGVGLLGRMSLRWTVSLVELNRAMRLVADGKQPDRVVADHDDEIGRLAHSFNEMFHNVESRADELRRSQQRAVNDNEQLATVLEAMIEGVIAVDQEERILLANTAAVRLLDLKSFDVVGRRTWEAIRLPQVHELIKMTLANQGQQRLEFRVPWTYSMVSVVASRLPGKPCPGMVLVLHDVTELRRLENLRRDFVSNVSHELKTPLAAITAYVDTLLNGALEDPTVNQMFVSRISEQAERLNTLILELLELAKIESGEHVFQVVPLDVNEILRKSVDAHLAIAQAKQIALTVTLPDAPLLGMADPEGLRTIIDNLIGNAINYTRPGGQVAVRSQQDQKHVLFEVEDNGVGIAKEFQARIFERFFRVDRARSRELGGTGLGLAIVKHLCQLFGGQIRVKSQVGQGSTFTVSLIAADAISDESQAIKKLNKE